MKVRIKKYFIYYGIEFFRGDEAIFKEEVNDCNTEVVGILCLDNNVPVMKVTRSFFNSHIEKI